MLERVAPLPERRLTVCAICMRLGEGLRDARAPMGSEGRRQLLLPPHPPPRVPQLVLALDQISNLPLEVLGAFTLLSLARDQIGHALVAGGEKPLAIARDGGRLRTRGRERDAWRR